MSAEIDSIISGAMSGLDGGSDGGADNDSGDAGTGLDSGDAGDTGTDLSTESGTDDGTATGGGTDGTEDSLGGDPQPEPTAAELARAAEDAAFDKELAELGLAAPKPGQKDNRIPYSRIRKIVANAKTKWSEKLTGEHTAKLTESEKAYNEYKQTIAGVERLIETNPDQYLATLAQIYPQHYKKYLADSGQNVQKEPAAKKDPEPQADIKYDDGSYGFSPEQFAKLREWDRREASRVAKEETAKEFNERFGGMEKAYQEVQRQGQDVAKVRGDIDKLRDQWGAETIDNQDVQKAIVAHLDANPKATLTQATRTVVMARIQSDRTAMRAEILKELKGAPKAAAKAPAAPNRGDANGANESIDDIIANAAKGLR